MSKYVCIKFLFLVLEWEVHKNAFWTSTIKAIMYVFLKVWWYFGWSYKLLTYFVICTDLWNKRQIQTHHLTNIKHILKERTWNMAKPSNYRESEAGKLNKLFFCMVRVLKQYEVNLIERIHQNISWLGVIALSPIQYLSNRITFCMKDWLLVVLNQIEQENELAISFRVFNDIIPPQTL